VRPVRRTFLPSDRVDDIVGPNNTRIPRWPLAATRIYLGVVFAVAGLRQLTDAAPWVKPGQQWAAAAHDKLVEWSAHTPTWYQGTLTHFMHHTDMGARHIAVLHVVLGVALVLGLFTRFTGAFAFLLLCNYMAASASKPYSPGPTAAFAALALAVSLASAGRMWGLDAMLARRVSRTGAQ